MSKIIQIFVRENDSLTATISVKDGSLVLDSNSLEHDFEEYFNEHKATWEKSEFTVHTGYMGEDGTLHDGRDKVTIADENYLNGLWEELYQNARKNVFNMKYYFVVK